jgi:hypothetical protein
MDWSAASEYWKHGERSILGAGLLALDNSQSSNSYTFLFLLIKKAVNPKGLIAFYYLVNSRMKGIS